jgi:F-type H+-transporting ATPase subunit b
MLHVQLSTIVFQMANFFILLAVLTWFLYRPLQRTMKQREDEIAARLRDAEERAHRADAERAQLAADAERVRTEAEAVLAAARGEASQLRQRLLDEARREAARYADEARERLDAQERAVRQRLEDIVRQTAVTMAGTLITRTVGPAFHQGLIEQWLAQGLTVSDEQAELLRRAFARANGKVLIETAYPLPPDVTAQIRGALARSLGPSASVPEFAVREEASLRAGVQIVIENVVIDLSLNRVLAELENGAAGR